MHFDYDFSSTINLHDITTHASPPPQAANKSMGGAGSLDGLHKNLACAGDPSPSAGTPACVLQELNVENLLLIEHAQLRLAPGLNVLTGETGAGKTVLAHALDLLLGGGAAAGSLRPRGGAGQGGGGVG